MSFWMVGGQFGVMFGPLAVTTVITTFSINATPWLMIPGILMSILLSLLLKESAKSSQSQSKLRKLSYLRKN